MTQDNNRSLLIPRSRRRGFIIQFVGLTILGFVIGSIAKGAIDYLVESLLLNANTKQFLFNKLPFEFFYNLLLRGVYASDSIYEAPICLIADILKGAGLCCMIRETVRST